MESFRTQIKAKRITRIRKVGIMKILKLTLIILMFPALLLAAETFDLGKFLLDMENSEKAIQNISFDFSQEIVFTLTKEKQTSAGQVSFMKPGNIYVKQTKPIEQVIVSDGKKVWIYTPGYNQVISDNWKKWTKNSMIPDSLLNMNQNWPELKKNYIFSYAGMEGKDRILLLTPAKKGGWKISFWINEDNFSISRLLLSADNIRITTYSYNYKINNSAMDKKLFKFSPPKGAEILKMD